MTKDEFPDVLICGAGAAGLTLAIDLARRGISLRLIEKMAVPFAGSRGKGIQPRTQEIFEDLRILDRVAALGGKYPLQRQYRPDGSFIEEDVTAGITPTPAEPYLTSLMVSQCFTERVMRERLAELGCEVEYGKQLVAFEQSEREVGARVISDNGEERIRARYLIGADGGRSFVREALGIGFPGKTLNVRAIVADVALTGLDREAWHRFNSESMADMLSICPLAGTELFQLQAPIPPGEGTDMSPHALEAMICGRTNRSDIQVESVAWASAYTMNARLADRYRDRRAFLIGDAAHVHPPTGAQGLNTSMQDAYNLGWKLAAVINGASEELLDTYEQERRRVAANMLGLSTELLDAAKRGDMRRGREVSQLDIHYRDSRISLSQARSASGVLAGDRAPDAPVTGAGGQSRRLFDLFAGPHWTLLGYAVEHRHNLESRDRMHVHTVGARGDLRDVHGHFRRAYGVPENHWVLVRPDGYIAAIVATTELGAMNTHMRRWTT